MQVINIIGITIIVIYILFILLKKNKQINDYLLILMNLIIGSYLGSMIWITHEINIINFIVHRLSSFYIYPAFLTYGSVLINRDHKLKLYYLWFYSFAIVVTLYLAIDLVFLTESVDVAYMKGEYECASLIYHIFFKANSFYVVFVSIWFLKQIKKYRQSIKEYYSFIEPIRLNWLKNFTIIMAFIYSYAIIIFTLHDIGTIEKINTSYLLLFVSIVLAVFYFSFNGIQQYTLANFEANDSFVEKKKGSNKYKSSSLTPSQIDLTYQKLIEAFEKQKLFLEPQLKIQKVAEVLNINIHHLSQVINHKAEKTFYEFVNHYRIKAFQEKLKNPQNGKYTILALAFECGFNSKASFNRIFKEQTGLTPSQYQNNNQ